jgi:hypothetical protein
MSTTPVAYNPSQSPIFGSEQIIDLAVGTTEQDYSQELGGVRWWMSPDQSDGYVIAEKVPFGDQPTAPGIIPPGSTVAFWKTDAKTSSDFLALAQFISRRAGTPPSFSTADDAKTWLNANGYWTSYAGATGDFSVTITQVGNDVVWSGSGSFNLTELTSAGANNIVGGFQASQAIWAIGPSVAVDTYSGTIAFPLTFGSGGVGVTSNTGSTFGILPGGSGRLLYVPSGYVSNTTISGTSTYANNTIAGMGLTPGTYTWSWGSGGNASTLVMTIS